MIVCTVGYGGESCMGGDWFMHHSIGYGVECTLCMVVSVCTMEYGEECIRVYIRAVFFMYGFL